MNRKFSFDEDKGILTVPTPKGDIVISVEEDYPGVYIDFKSNDIKESAKLLGEDSIQLARIEYDTKDKELKTLLWENPENQDCSYRTTFNDALTFNEDFNILPIGTKVEYCGQIAYIVGDDRDNCPEGYHSSLNYFIKYALKDEKYEDVLKRIENSNEEWYDEMIFWDDINKVIDIKISTNSLKNNFNKYFSEIENKMLEGYDMDTLEDAHLITLRDDIIETLFFSFSDIITDFIYENKTYFNLNVLLDAFDNIEEYIDSLFASEGKIEPFVYHQPKEFFLEVENFAKKLINNK